MALLLETGIESKVRENIRGLAARAGGTVNQLLDYRGLKVEDINLPDGGFGRVAAIGSSGSPVLKIKNVARYARQELQYLRHGPAVPRDRKTIIADMHQAGDFPKLFGRYDAAVSSNLLEHSPNPVLLLLNFYLITKEGGWQFHAIPHHRYTYDRFREPTPAAHLMEDFLQGRDRTDRSHDRDYIQSAIEKDGWQRKFHEKYPVEYPYLHFHVFDEGNTGQLFSLLFQEVTSDLLVDGTFSDNVVLFRNALNPIFVEKHREAILRRLPELADRINKVLP